MAINPPSDIVLDVARAADPERYREAVDRLQRLRGATHSTETFALADAATATTTAHAAKPSAAAGPAHAAVATSPRPRLDAYGKFEAFVLQSFLESVLPKDATTVFGSGSAGEFWRSMLAEKLADELARSGQLGIAQQLARGPGQSSHPTPSDAPPSSEQGAIAPSLAPPSARDIPLPSAQAHKVAPDVVPERT